MSLWDGFEWEDEIPVPCVIAEPRVARVLESPVPQGSAVFSSFRLELEPGVEVVASNIVYPGARKNDRVWVYPSPGGGLQLHDSNWMLSGPGVANNSEPLRLGDLDSFFVDHEAELHRMLREINAERGSPETVLSRAKIDALYGRLSISPDPALCQRALAISRELTYGDVVLVRDSQDRGGMSHYSWQANPQPSSGLAIVTNPSDRPVTLGPLEGQPTLTMHDGRTHPRPGLYLWAASEASRLLGALDAHIVSVTVDTVELELLGVIHRVPRHGVTWSATARLTDLFTIGQSVQVVVRCTSPCTGQRLRVLTTEGTPEGLPTENALLTPGSWRLTREEPGRVWVAVLVNGVEVHGFVRDRWLPVWDDSVGLRVLHSDDFSRCLLLGDEVGSGRPPLSDRWVIGDAVHGLVLESRADSVIVEVEGFRGRIPAEELPKKYRRDLTSVVGKEFDLTVSGIDERRGTLLLRCVTSNSPLVEGDPVSRPLGDYDSKSRRRKKQLSEAKTKRSEAKIKLLQEIEPGQVRKGRVKNIADFGAFIDLGGIDGLLHITDMSWSRIGHPTEMVKIDDEIEVMVLHIDREKEKIALGLKQKLPSPWDDIDKRYPVGSRIKGEVVNVMSYGAFVKLEDGIEGLVHISEMSWTKRVSHPSELVKSGDPVEVVVLGINNDKQEISLGMKQTQPNPWDNVAAKYPVGKVVTGTVRNLTNYGAFIELEEGVDGLLHVSDMSWTRKISHASEMLKKGDSITCQVISVDEQRKRIALGLKQMDQDPWSGPIPDRYAPGTICKGKVTKITNFGVFVELEEQLEGLLHVSELSDQKVANPEDVVKVGDTIDVKVLRVDSADRKIGLSRKLDAPIEEIKAAQGGGNAGGGNDASRQPRELKGGMTGGAGPLFSMNSDPDQE